MQNITQAIVLRNTKYKENDLIVTLFSVDKGKIAALSKGVLKAGAKLNFAAQPFCFAQYVLFNKSGRNTVISASLNDSFYDLRTNLLKFYGACAAAEFCEKMLPDETPMPELFFLFVTCIKSLCYTSCPERGTIIRFFIDAINAAGYKTNFSSCGICQKKISGVQFFDFEKGSVTCGECASGRKLSDSTLNVICSVEDGCYSVSNPDGEIRALKLLKVYINEKMGIDLEFIDRLTNEELPY